jgi:two-component system phosphate regulon sensor histidine kinase PhoR
LHDVKGFGIGLNFVQKVVEGHKGQIRVESEPGSGSKFQMKIPFK